MRWRSTGDLDRAMRCRSAVRYFDASERSWILGHSPRFSCRFPGDHRFATSPPSGWKIDTTSATLIMAKVCECDTISRLGGYGRPGVASGEFVALAIDAPLSTLRGGRVPAEVVAPDYPINGETALKCVVPLQFIIRPTGPPLSPRQRLAP
jgi:hypothetical protein